LVKAANPELKAMILLGINGGFGRKDCWTPAAGVVARGWHNYPLTFRSDFAQSS
jgi:hypothetical protein